MRARLGLRIFPPQGQVTITPADKDGNVNSFGQKKKKHHDKKNKKKNENTEVIE